MDEVRISRATNGYIASIGNNHEIYVTLEDVLNRLLLHYEGLSEYFDGVAFGKVSILRDKEFQSIVNSLPESE